MPIDIDGLSFEELLELNQRVVARLKMLESMQAHIEMMQFNLGQRVSFEHQGGRILATLVKYNVSAPESTPFFRTPSATDFLLSHHNAGECHGPDRQY